MQWCRDCGIETYSEQNQDHFVLWITGQKRQGCFVEFGAMDGLRASNTLVLERRYDWQGVVVEPLPKYRDLLPLNRRCRIDNRCIGDRSGRVVDFSTADTGGYPGIIGYNSHGASGTVIRVNTVSLEDLLIQHDMPREIDYVSMDVDGAEVMILKSFNFNRRRINIWSIEHNELMAREEILGIMSQHGYQRIIYTQHCYDDFYVHYDYLKYRNLI